MEHINREPARTVFPLHRRDSPDAPTPQISIVYSHENFMPTLHPSGFGQAQYSRPCYDLMVNNTPFMGRMIVLVTRVRNFKQLTPRYSGRWLNSRFSASGLRIRRGRVKAFLHHCISACHHCNGDGLPGSVACVLTRSSYRITSITFECPYFHRLNPQRVY